MFSVRLYRIGPYAQRLYTLAPLKTVLRRDRRKKCHPKTKPNPTENEWRGKRNEKQQKSTEKRIGIQNRNESTKHRRKKKHIVRELKNITNTKSERVHVNNTLRRLFVHSHRLHFYFACTLKSILYNSEWSSIQTIFLEKLKNNNVHSPSPSLMRTHFYVHILWILCSSPLHIVGYIL